MTRQSTTTADLTQPNTLVRYLQVDGRVSTDTARVVEVDMRKGRVTLAIMPGGVRRISINRRRLLPVDTDPAATVVEAGDRYRALCPACGKSVPIVQGDEAPEASCPQHGSFPLYWLGVKPMNDEVITTKPKPKAERAAPKPKAAKAPRPPKPKREPVQKKPRVQKPAQALDIGTIVQIGELYTKSDINFDHEHVHVLAHVLLVEGPAGVRKFCFNTYNGSLGKKSKVDVDSFRAPDAGYAVKDLDKERTRLHRDGYVAAPNKPVELVELIELQESVELVTDTDIQ